MGIQDYISPELRERYDFRNYNHALEILTQAFPAEWNDIKTFLSAFTITLRDLEESGGNESAVPVKLRNSLAPRRWKSVQVTGDLHIKYFEKVVDQRRYEAEPYREEVVSGYLTSRAVDFLKHRVAVICAWNSKDSIFDRDLESLKMFYEANIISAGILITRGSDFNDALEGVCYSNGEPVKKYGTSTTYMEKLLPRLDSRQNGGCPILAIGISKRCFEVR